MNNESLQRRQERLHELILPSLVLEPVYSTKTHKVPSPAMGKKQSNLRPFFSRHCCLLPISDGLAGISETHYAAKLWYVDLHWLSIDAVLIHSVSVALIPYLSGSMIGHIVLLRYVSLFVSENIHVYIGLMKMLHKARPACGSYK